MTQTSINYKIKKSLPEDSIPVLTMFFSEWLDEAVGKYSIERTQNIKVMLDNPEDAMYLLLRGIPKEFSNHLEL